VLVLIALLNAVMTFYTYFKDYEGDRQAGVLTFVARHGLSAGRLAGMAFAFLFVVSCAVPVMGEALPLRDILFREKFLFICAVTVFLQVWTGWLCTAQGKAIGTFMREHGLASTPIPWPLTQTFLAERGGRDTGSLTPLYVKMGIYTP